MDTENKYGTLEVQKQLLELIKHFDDFCKKNHIEYSLNDGTLLGAVRHDGFIPWDDDLDVIMDRRNYTKLTKLNFEGSGMCLNRVLWLDRVQFIQERAFKKSIPTLDVFILDVAPKTRMCRIMKKLMICFLQGIIKGRPNYSKFSFIYKCLSFITYIIGLFFPIKLKIKLYHIISSKLGSKTSNYASCYFEPYNEIGILHKVDVLDSLVMHKFENTMLPIMSNFHDYLTEMYGDYMTPPREEDRIPLHI